MLALFFQSEMSGLEPCFQGTQRAESNLNVRGIPLYNSYPPPATVPQKWARYFFGWSLAGTKRVAVQKRASGKLGGNTESYRQLVKNRITNNAGFAGLLL